MTVSRIQLIKCSLLHFANPPQAVIWADGGKLLISAYKQRPTT